MRDWLNNRKKQGNKFQKEGKLERKQVSKKER